MSQKLLKQPAQLLFIALVAVPAMTIALNAAPLRTYVRQTSGHRTADTARPRPRPDIYLNEGIERWGLNE